MTWGNLHNASMVNLRDDKHAVRDGTLCNCDERVGGRCTEWRCAPRGEKCEMNEGSYGPFPQKVELVVDPCAGRF